MPSESPSRVSGRGVRGPHGVRALGPTAAVVVLFLMAMIAAAIQGEPTFRPSDPAPPPTADTSPTTAPGSTGTPEPFEVDPTGAAIVQMLGVILMVFVAACTLALVVLIVRALLRAWRGRPLRRRDAAEVEAAADETPMPAEPQVAVTVIQRGISGALRALDGSEPPADAIIAAWVGLEESAADAGVRRAANETPGEFALRIITLRTGIADEAVALLGLYERVRFGTLVATEQDRLSARRALQRIEEGWR